MEKTNDLDYLQYLLKCAKLTRKPLSFMDTYWRADYENLLFHEKQSGPDDGQYYFWLGEAGETRSERG